MLLAIDIGNTNVVFGIFAGKRLVKEWRSPTYSNWFKTLPAKVESVIVSSVVPGIDGRLKKFVRSKYGYPPIFIGAEKIKGLNIKVQNKKEVGADRLVNAYAAYKIYGGPVIIVDFGTATTICAVTKNGNYLGGAITPGIGISTDALYEKAAKLPRIQIGKPKRVIGRNTIEAMLSGIIYGSISLVEGMVERFKKEVGSRSKVIATGGFSKLIAGYTKLIDIVDPDLTLKGLQMIWSDLHG